MENHEKYEQMKSWEHMEIIAISFSIFLKYVQ